MNFDEIQNDYTKTQLVAKKNEEACFVKQMQTYSCLLGTM